MKDPQILFLTILPGFSNEFPQMALLAAARAPISMCPCEAVFIYREKGKMCLPVILPNRCSNYCNAFFNSAAACSMAERVAGNLASGLRSPQSWIIPL